MADTTSAVWSLLFGVRRSVRYHMRRQRFFDRLDQVAALASLVAGSSTVVPCWQAAVMTSGRPSRGCNALGDR